MTDDLKERLKVVARCDTDSAMRHFAYAFMEQDPDGDYVTYAAAKARITDLEARLAAAKKQCRESDKKLTNQRHEINWLKEQQRALKDSLAAAEAGEDALAEALIDGAQGWTDMCTDALAAYEARRKG